MVEHIPAELTIVVRAGTLVTDLADILSASGQWWPQAPITPGATVGGVVSAGASGLRRLRYGPLRDSLLEVTFVTGDGRTVRGGGPTVKGVAGYDLPRLLTGARGTLGFITQVILKLAPLPAARAWYSRGGSLQERLHSARELAADPRRPAAIVLTPAALHVELAGASPDVTAPSSFAFAEQPGLPQAAAVVQLGVPPSRVAQLVAQLEDGGFPYVGQFGVGVCEVGVDRVEHVAMLRGWATTLGGHAVVVDAPDEYRADPWGPAPTGVGIMQRMYAAFDPRGVLSPQHRLVP